MRQILQEAAAETTTCTYLMPGKTAYMAFIDASGEGFGRVWMRVA